MTRKDHQARRILSLFQHLHQLEAGHLSRLEARVSELAKEERALVSYLEGGGVLSSVFSDLVLNKLRSTAQRHKTAKLAVEIQTSRALEQARRVKQGERLVAKIERDREVKTSQWELREIIDSTFSMTRIRPP
jgi:hypothetical protein